MGRTLPFLTGELATQIENSITFFSLEKQKALSALPGNPYGVQIRSFGNATAFLAQNTHNDEIFNHVTNMQRDDLPYLDAIINWYGKYRVQYSFDLVPSNTSPLFLWSLAAKGFYQSGFYSVGYGLPERDTPSPSNIVIRPVTPEEKDLVAAVYCESFEVPRTETYAYVRESIRVLVAIPTNVCFFALVNDTVAALLVLSIYQDIGYLALAATRPSFRGYGCQKALLRTAIATAAQAGCHLITGQAGVTTLSHQNGEKLGLRIAYTKAIWSVFQQEKQPDEETDPVNR